MMFECTECGEVKGEEEYHTRTRASGNTHRYKHCKSCHRKKQKKHYNQNKGEYVQKAKLSKEKYRLWYQKYKETLCCSKCGEDHPATLDFHHESDDKEFNVSEAAAQGESKEKLMKVIDKCVVLCANCHRKHHYASVSARSTKP